MMTSSPKMKQRAGVVRLASASVLAAVLAAPALAQEPPASGAIDTQLNWGDVFATMDVVTQDRARFAISNAAAVGNAVTAVNGTGAQTLTGAQINRGAIEADATLTGGDVRHEAIVSAQAQANAAEAGASGGRLQLRGQQRAEDGDVRATASANIGNAGVLTTAAAASANNALAWAENGDLETDLSQDNKVSVRAFADSDACCTGLTQTFATAAANSYASTSETSTATTTISQTSSGDIVHASADSWQPTGYDVTTASNAAGNSASMANKWGYANVTADQTNDSFVGSEARTTVNEWSGVATTSAYGVGNAILATNVGSDMTTASTQTNNGGVIGYAQFNGGTGGDVALSSTAIGNAYTGSVCSQCGDAVLTGNVTQVNTGSVQSIGTISAGNAHSIIGNATAIGNTATFITNRANSQ
ncbi:MAG: holdfast anchor protein HfaD [Hyphomonadaceae bacterium]